MATGQLELHTGMGSNYSGHRAVKTTTRNDADHERGKNEYDATTQLSDHQSLHYLHKNLLMQTGLINKKDNCCTNK